MEHPKRIGVTFEGTINPEVMAIAFGTTVEGLASLPLSHEPPRDCEYCGTAMELDEDYGSRFCPQAPEGTLNSK